MGERLASRRTKKNGVSITLQLEDVVGEVMEEAFMGIGSYDAATTEFSVVLHQNGARSGSSKGVFAVGSQDHHCTATFEAQSLLSPSTEIVVACRMMRPLWEA